MEQSAFERLPGFADDDALAAFRVFRGGADALLGAVAPLRAAKRATPGLLAAARAALSATPLDADAARAFFVQHFQPRRIGSGFLTGYYEPWVEGALEPSPEFPWPLLARPPDLIAFAPGEGPSGFDPALAGARRLPDGALSAYPVRAEIEAAAREPVVWLADAVEAFIIQVQGSARVRLRDESWRRLIYDGRNGRPYTSIGRRLIEAGEIDQAKMSLARLKAWLRENPERGRALMRRNESYVFFRLAEDGGEGPIGGAGRPLTPLRSLAIDRTLWSYGLPFYPVATLPWRDDRPEPFARLMIAEDTGSAIVGAGRADLFFGGGETAGARAGAIRHEAEMFVLWPKADGP